MRSLLERTGHDPRPPDSPDPNGRPHDGKSDLTERDLEPARRAPMSDAGIAVSAVGAGLCAALWVVVVVLMVRVSRGSAGTLSKTAHCSDDREMARAEGGASLDDVVVSR